MSSKTLKQLVEAVMDGETPPDDEMRLGLVMMDRLLNSAVVTLINLAEIKTPTSNDTFYAADCLLSELRLAVSSEPAKWLGNLGDPKNPEMQERRLRAKARNLKALH